MSDPHSVPQNKPHLIETVAYKQALHEYEQAVQDSPTDERIAWSRFQAKAQELQKQYYAIARTPPVRFVVEVIPPNYYLKKWRSFVTCWIDGACVSVHDEGAMVYSTSDTLEECLARIDTLKRDFLQKLILHAIEALDLDITTEPRERYDRGEL